MTYLDGLPPEQAAALDQVNRAGLAALRTYLADGDAIAFLGAGASVPLYPLWGEVIGELVDAAVERGLGDDAARSCRALSADEPDGVVEILRRHLGPAQYQAALRETFRVRRDPESGRTWTATHELVCRCAFRAVVTTNYDPGIVDARMRVRPTASGTGFASWTDELTLDRWRTGEVFGGDELPVLFAHGQHNQPDSIVLATTEYRKAYAGKLSGVLARMVDSAHLVWIGFSFADQRIRGVLREIAERSGTRIEPGAPVRHIAIMAWDPMGDRDPQTLRQLGAIQYGADLVLYPAPDGDHSALQRLLAALTDERYPSAPAAVSKAAAPVSLPVRWEHGAEEGRFFTGRMEELARLDRWAADPAVRLVGVTAWGGAGKTALVTHWLQRTVPAGRRGAFAWSFYADPSADHWAEGLLEWARRELGLHLDGRGSVAAAVIKLVRSVPLVLVLDGLEVVQEGPATDAYGRLLDGVLREVLTASCRIEHGSLVVLTSRFPFADLQIFDGTSARMLEVLPFTPTEGAAVLADASPGTLTDDERRAFVAEVDGHALAVAAMAALLAEHPGTTADLRSQLAASGRTGEKVARVLSFYADRLSHPHRCLVAAVSLFSRPVGAEQVLTVGGHETFDGHLDGWDVYQVRAAVRGPLAGLLSWHPDGTISAHPLVRETFRPLALGAALVAVEATLTSATQGTVRNRAEALRVVEAIELSIEAGHWTAADDLYRNRTNAGKMWRRLPAARLGQRAATAFVATPARREECRARLSARILGFYLVSAGMDAMNAGDVAMAQGWVSAGVNHDRASEDWFNLAIALMNLADGLNWQGQPLAAVRAATEALAHATTAGSGRVIADVRVCLGWSAGLAGDVPTAERCFQAADRFEYANDADHDHLYSLRGVQWAELLARTGREEPARRLVARGRAIAQNGGWTRDVARCQVMLVRLDLAAGDAAASGPEITAAIACLRDGDLLVDLADGLTVAAEHARVTGELEAADDHATEALEIAAPRGLVPTHTAALAARARVAADRHAATRDSKHLYRGRDAADAAARLASGADPLPWQELEAMRAHAHLDKAEGVDRGWAGRAATLHKQLVPDGLDPDPLATVEAERDSE